MTPEQKAELRAAFAAHILKLPGMRGGFPAWHDRNVDLLKRVAAAAGTPDSLAKDLVDDLVFKDDNGICLLNNGSLAMQIRGYNKRFPHLPAKTMPTVEAFVPLVSSLLTIRNAGKALSPEDYRAFRSRFFEESAGMNLAAAANRVVVAVFPDRFTTPVALPQMRSAHEALARRGFVPFLESSGDLEWFERSALVARELRAVLDGNGFDDAYLSSFVWFAGEYFPARG